MVPGQQIWHKNYKKNTMSSDGKSGMIYGCAHEYKGQPLIFHGLTKHIPNGVATIVEDMNGNVHVCSPNCLTETKEI